jgi:hypothetical protein
MNRKINLYWFYLLFFMKKMNHFIERSVKNGGLGFRVQGSGFRVHCSGSMV